MEREPVTVNTSLDTLYRLDFDDDGVLLRIARNSEKMSASDQALADARGLQLLDVNNEDVEAAGGFGEVLEDLAKAGTQDITLLLVPNQNTAEEEERQKKSAIQAPTEVVTDLREDMMESLLKKKSLAKVPLGSCMYLNHPNWKLTGMGALVLLKPGCLKELDLRDNDLKDVGGGLTRFEALTELRLSGNKLRQVELTYMPRLTWIDLSFNCLTAIPEVLGLPMLQYIDLSDNEVGTRGGASDEPAEGPTVVSGESPDGWERLAHSPLVELRHLLLANNQLNWGQAPSLTTARPPAFTTNPTQMTPRHPASLPFHASRLARLRRRSSTRAWPCCERSARCKSSTCAATCLRFMSGQTAKGRSCNTASGYSHSAAASRSSTSLKSRGASANGSAGHLSSTSQAMTARAARAAARAAATRATVAMSPTRC